MSKIMSIDNPSRKANSTPYSRYANKTLLQSAVLFPILTQISARNTCYGYQLQVIVFILTLQSSLYVYNFPQWASREDLPAAQEMKIYPQFMGFQVPELSTFD